MTPYDLSDDAALDRLLDAIEAGETALSAPFGLPAGVGCWYRQGPAHGWLKLNVAEWIYYRLIRCEGMYVRRTR